MSSNTRKDTIFNSAVLFATWLAVIVAATNNDVEATSQVVRIAYQVE